MTAVTAALLTLVPGVLRLLWACGVTAGRSTGGGRLMELVFVGFLAAAVTGAWQLAFRRGGALAVLVPLALAWVGSGAAVCWGGWMSLAALVTSRSLGVRPAPATSLTYAVQMIVGFLVVSVAAHHFADRSAKVPR